MFKNLSLITFIIVSIFGSTGLLAQSTFETVIPQRDIVAGESFRIQYVVKNAKTVEQFKSPPINYFRIISGPDIYKGSVVGKNGLVYMTNFAFTVVAAEEGRYLVKGGTALIDGKLKKSNDAFVKIISKESAQGNAVIEEDSTESSLFVKRDENILDKIRQNLFIRVSVDKRTCFVGEPVVAEFKLFSRLESRSEIIKNPGFYGFGVHDIIGMGERASTTQIIDGKPFDVHVIRKVQLYPLQPGDFTIDAMEVDNRVLFNMRYAEDSGLTADNTPGNQPALGVDDFVQTFDLVLQTSPVKIKVKPLPSEKTTKNFTGAVGSFNITGKIDREDLKKNQEGKLVITIRGKGNLSQISAPTIEWPAALENFEASAEENFDRRQVPLHGSKTFEFPFVGNKPGDYIIPPVEFTFFNTGMDRYETVQTLPFSIKISNERFGGITAPGAKETSSSGSAGSKLVWGAAGLGVIALLVFLFTRRKKNVTEVKEQAAVTRISIPVILQPAKEMMGRGNPEFYSKLKDAAWAYFADRLGITGSDQNKEVLKSRMEEKGIENNLVNDVQQLLQQCELHIYTGMATANDEAFLFSQAESFMYKCDRVLIPV